MILAGFVLYIVAVQGAVGEVAFDIAPFNTTSAVGQNATMACIVSGLAQNTDHVKWKRMGKTETVLTKDSVSISDDRYQTTGKYNLTITDVVTSDEGTYVCEISGSKTITKQMYLTVVELPLNLTIYWSTTPYPGGSANLTCFAERARPAPTFLWFKNEKQQNLRQYYLVQNRGSGYQDAYSTITVPLIPSDKGSKFRCQAEYTGWDRAMEYTITTAFGCSQSIAGTLSLILTASVIGLFF